MFLIPILILIVVQAELEDGCLDQEEEEGEVGSSYWGLRKQPEEEVGAHRGNICPLRMSL